tara:strand:- start:2467 stop:3129 length:663 start_codon:yes stop_codon:yes gene_type:complete
MRKIKAIGFDFDGTLIVSEHSKAEEMAKVFQEKFGIKKGVQQAYKKLRGQNRHQKVNALFQQFVKRKPTQKELKEIEDHFGKHYFQSMKTCPLFQCTNIIGELKKQVKFLFLLSLEEKKDVKKLIKHCGLEKYFDEILGGPKSKIDNLDHVTKKHHLQPQEIIYIGDSPGDIIAGKKKKIKVILIGQKFNYSAFRKKLGSQFVLSSLCDLPEQITKLLAK